MGRIKDFYRNNRIYCILMIVSVICLIAVGTSVIAYFVNQATSDPYGYRLKGLDEKEISKSLESLKTWFKGHEEAMNLKVRLQGKIIYIEFEVAPTMTNEEVSNLATASLEGLSEETKTTCDLQFIITREGMQAYFGAKNSSNTAISWTNYNMNIETTETTTTKKKK